jgi:hypothetical protein
VTQAQRFVFLFTTFSVRLAARSPLKDGIHKIEKGKVNKEQKLSEEKRFQTPRESTWGLYNGKKIKTWK